MSEPVKIDALEIENVKCIKAVRIQCDGRALTTIGGRNKQGKSSVLDAIAYALGGEMFRPTNLKREGALADPGIKVVLSNGFIAERKGKNSSLKVTDPTGRSGGQQLLNQFVSQFALDLPKFLHSTTKEKAGILLQIIGVGEELSRLEGEEERLYNEREAFGRIADQKRKFAAELPVYADAPDVPISAMELIREQQGILARNGENQRKRHEVGRLEAAHGNTTAEVAQLRKALAEAEQRLATLSGDLETARKTAQQVQDESTAEIEASLQEIDATNVKVRANMDKEKANEDAEAHQKHYQALTEKIDETRKKKMDLLTSADLPLDGLSVEKGELIFDGQPWGCMAGSEQLRVATAIVRRLNPNCGFVLIDKLEQMDTGTLQEFGHWLEQEGFQAITTRVSTGGECSILIEDGFSVIEGQKNFVAGEF